MYVHSLSPSLLKPRPSPPEILKGKKKHGPFHHTAQTHPIEHVYMQDPIFNRLDEEFLRSDRGYTVLANPEAFAKLTPTAFLFAPHLEWPVYIHALQVVVPALCIGNRVTEYLDHHLPVEQSPQQQQREILAAFRDKTESTEMPDFDRASWCMSTSIYWRRDG